MQLNLAELTGAVNKISSLASDMKQIPGILLTIRDNETMVCFTDGKRAVAEKVTTIVGDGEVRGSIIVPYNTFSEVIASCQPTGLIKVDCIEMEIKDNGVATIKVEKKISMRQNADSDEEYERVVSKMKQNISWAQPNADVRNAVLCRMDYDKLFEVDVDGEPDATSTTPLVWDEWSRELLLNALNRISCDDGKTCFISAKNKGAFVANMAFLSYVVCPEAEKSSAVMTTKLAKQIYDVISKCKSDKFLVGVKDVYCTVVDSEDKMAVWFEMPKPDRMSLNTLENFLSHQYNDLCSIFYRPAFENVLKCCIASNKNSDNAKLAFKFGEEINLSFKVSGGNSLDDDFSVVAEKVFGGKLEEAGVTENLSMSLGTLANMVKNCANDYIALCIEVSATGKFLNVVDIKGKDENGGFIPSANYYSVLL